MQRRSHNSKIGRVSYYTDKSPALIQLEADIEELLAVREELQSELRSVTGELIDKQLLAARMRHTRKA